MKTKCFNLTEMVRLEYPTKADKIKEVILKCPMNTDRKKTLLLEGQIREIINYLSFEGKIKCDYDCDTEDGEGGLVIIEPYDNGEIYQVGNLNKEEFDDISADKNSIAFDYKNTVFLINYQKRNV